MVKGCLFHKAQFHYNESVYSIFYSLSGIFLSYLWKVESNLKGFKIPLFFLFFLDIFETSLHKLKCTFWKKYFYYTKISTEF